MIRERARVVAVEGPEVHVEANPASGCHGCVARSGCGTGALSDWLGRRRPLVVITDMTTSPGDEVVLEIPGRGLLAASTVAYILPLLILLTGAVAGRALASGLPLDADAGALAGLVLSLGLWWALLARGRRATARVRVVEVRPGGGHNDSEEEESQ
ncbi:SoxR reducing system RseC family protein [Arhodomonas sp. SL1]|uniref:SoxR reducing system RseC family protein n=1 Tax=Arhodomonas sp. SL1 TaxID=3425691 RepID=UPI003F883722